MKLTAELSLYPLNEQYIPIIQAFIDAVNLHPGLSIVTNAMSTQIAGDYDTVFRAVEQELAASYRHFGRQVLVVKFIVGELDIAADV
ncbi:MAG: YkoF family thiamine/hydroxymethylpyrimidine-binding protein [Halioglobus sp.]